MGLKTDAGLTKPSFELMAEFIMVPFREESADPEFIDK
jgi:hypothetical protein